MRKFKKILTSVMMAAAMLAVGPMALAEEASSLDAAPAAEEADFDPSGTYHAALGIQTCNTVWINRQAYFTDSLNNYYGTDMNEKLWAGDPSAEGSVYDGTFTDIEIKGNGTYTVKLEGADFSGETAISQLYVATDIPVNDVIKVTDFKVNINGKDVVTFPEAELEDEEKYTEGGMIILAINHWRDTLVEKLASLGVTEDASSGITLLTGAGNENISLTFTISGFDYDNEAPADDSSVEDTEDSAATSEAVTTESKADDKEDIKFPVVPFVIALVVVVAAIAIAVIFKNRKK